MPTPTIQQIQQMLQKTDLSLSSQAAFMKKVQEAGRLTPQMKVELSYYIRRTKKRVEQQIQVQRMIVEQSRSYASSIHKRSTDRINRIRSQAEKSANQILANTIKKVTTIENRYIQQKTDYGESAVGNIMNQL